MSSTHNLLTSQPHILYEDQDLMLIAKPPGVVVNSAETTPEVTVQEWFAKYLSEKAVRSQDNALAESRTAELPRSAAVPELSQAEWQLQVPEEFESTFGTPEEIWAERCGIVHRLDRETSGVLLLAKHPGSLVALLRQFKQREVQKEYLCLVHGKLPVDHDMISLPLGRATRDRKLFAVVPDGRPAETEYAVEAFFPQFNRAVLDAHWSELKSRAPQGFRKRLSSYQSFSLLRCKPRTGRTHQIRVHLAHLKHPIVGDQTYGGKKRQKLDAAWCPRHFLHAESLMFQHPRTRESMTITAPLSEDLQKALEFVTESA
jgi:23S rRNA-/tRNA-specific pseudouridylate synthase